MKKKLFSLIIVLVIVVAAVISVSAATEYRVDFKSAYTIDANQGNMTLRYNPKNAFLKNRASSDINTPTSDTVYELTVTVEIISKDGNAYTSSNRNAKTGTVNSGKAYIDDNSLIDYIEHFSHRYTANVGHLEEWYNKCCR